MDPHWGYLCYSKSRYFVNCPTGEKSDTRFVFNYRHHEMNTSAGLEAVALVALYQDVFKHILGKPNPVLKKVPALLITELMRLCTMKHLKKYKNKAEAS